MIPSIPNALGVEIVEMLMRCRLHASYYTRCNGRSIQVPMYGHQMNMLNTFRTYKHGQKRRIHAPSLIIKISGFSLIFNTVFLQKMTKI